MNLKISVMLTLIVAGVFVFPALSILAWQTEGAEVYSEEDAVKAALNYLLGCPTFKFDGLSDSIEVKDIEMLNDSWTWEISIAFDCRQAGYGERTGKILAQVISPHQMRVVVQRGNIVQAIIDEVWDELAQKMITN